MPDGLNSNCGGCSKRVIPEGEKKRWSSKIAGPVEAFFVKHRERLAYLHVAMFFVFVAVILVPVYLPESAENATPFNDFRTFANFALWGLWFPLVFLSVIVTGRSWCGVLCPMGAASEWGNKVGLQREIPKFIKWRGTPIVSFLIVTILGQTVGVRDHAEGALEVFGGTMLIAIIIGLVYAKNNRAWCRHMCPIGLLLGVFSRLGAVQFTPKAKKAGGDGYVENGLCPTMIKLNTKEESRHCIQCFRCVNPPRKGGLFLRLRRPGEEIEQIRKHHPNMNEIWFLFLGTGIAIGGFLWLVLPVYEDIRIAIGEFFFERGWTWVGDVGPWWLMVVQPERREVFLWLDFLMIVGFMSGVMLALTAILMATTALSAWTSGLMKGDRTFKERFVELGYQYAPVAMVSLIIGLGGVLFDGLGLVGIGPEGIGYTKGVFFMLGLIWSLYLGNRILAGQGLSFGKRFVPMVPGIAGSIAVGLFWWPAIFGL